MVLKRRFLGASLAAIALIVAISLGFVHLAGVRPQLTAPVVQAAPSPPGGASVVQSALIAASEKVGPAVVSVKTDQGLGSGVIYDAAGQVLTNNHVVADASSITVGLADGRRFPAQVLGTDSAFDLAVLKIDGSNLPVAQLGKSSTLQPGQFVVAIGNPYGFDHTVTVGVVSALNRPVSEGQGSYNQPMIQTDTAINPGNSGGPLVDLDGNVVGINTLIAAPQGVPAQGLGFAIPVDTVSRIAPQLAQNGKVTHSGQAYLGVGLADLSGTTRQPAVPSRRGSRSQPANPGVDHGALIGQVQPGSPAAQAGLQTNDVIVSFDGKDVYGSDDFLQDLVLHQPGNRVALGIVRNGASQSVTVTLGEAPANQG